MDTTDIIKAAGGPVRVAKLCKLASHSTVSEWREVPAKHALTVAAAANIAPHVVRPDIYPLGVGIPDGNTESHSGSSHVSLTERGS